MSRMLGCTAMLIALVAGPAMSDTEDRRDWGIDVGARWFKHSASGVPNELGYNDVFSRWEQLASGRVAGASVTMYRPLEPLYFNMNFGVDAFIRYRNRFFLRLGYDYSDPMGIGGTGRIEYVDSRRGYPVAFEEEKAFSYTSHQINTFLGVLVSLGTDDAEAYMGFSPMAPTWVSYREQYVAIADSATLDATYDRTFSGFFGSCRALLGMQVSVGDRVKVGSELVFAFLNYMKLSSGDIKDHSFRFPNMLWSFTVRYSLVR
jgi:hypothetical protein